MKKENLINKLIIIISIVVNLINFIFIKNKELTDVLLFIIFNVVLFLPQILRTKFNIKFNTKTELLFLIFMDLAFLLGSNMDLYKKIYWYDSFVHLISGTLSALLALLLLKFFKRYDTKNIIYNLTYMLAVTMMIASMWEMVEFSIDLIFKVDTQKALTTGVNDTMKDMICALFGYVLTSIWYSYEIKTKQELFISRLLKD